MKNFISLAALFALSVAPASAQQIPAGTIINVRTIDRVESESSSSGETFRASLTDPIVVSGRTIAPAGADAMLRVVDVKEAGKVRGKAELTVTLASITSNGQVINLTTANTTSVGKGKGKGTGIKTGVGAGIGAALGAIFGGGKGAAIGAGAGAATGAGVAMVMSGPRVVIPSETRLSFAVR